MTTKKRDYYDVLGLSKSCSDEEIRKAFRKLALEYHPDRNREKGSSERFKEINEAYQVLVDPQKKARYDRFGHEKSVHDTTQGFDGFDNFGGFGDIFDAFFGGQSAERAGSLKRRGRDLQHPETVSFEEAAFGTKRDFKIRRTEICDFCKGGRSEPGSGFSRCGNCVGSGQIRRESRGIFGQFTQLTTCSTCAGEGQVINQRCSKCQGKGLQIRNRKLEVSIPPGIETGTQIRLSSEGEPGYNGGPPGHLYVSVRVKSHHMFSRDKYDILIHTKVNVALAALGGVRLVPTLNGEMEITIPPGTQTGDVVRLNGKGIPHLRDRKRRGDQVVSIVVETPKSLSQQQRRLLSELRDTFSDVVSESSQDDKNWLNKIKDTLG